jgi:hypothetical protein
MSELIGRWERMHNGFTFHFEFQNNGRFETDEFPGSGIHKGTYTTNNNNLEIRTDAGMEDFFLYKVNGSELILANALGMKLHYTKAW